MVFRQFVRLSLAALFVSAVMPGFSQVVPAATQKTWPIEIGGGLSYFGTHIINHEFPTVDYKSFDGNLLGPAAWLDFNLPHMPQRIYGLGIEMEGRMLSWDNSGTDPLLKEKTGQGGVIYKWHHYHNLRPYGKFLMGFGSIDFQGTYPGCKHDCNHDTDKFLDMGGGAEYRVRGDLWVRGDYEYELWTGFGQPANKTVYPKGFTVGVTYDMRHFQFGRKQEY
jgi:Outer membrane protein beta-barrel domain